MYVSVRVSVGCGGGGGGGGDTSIQKTPINPGDLGQRVEGGLMVFLGASSFTVDLWSDFRHPKDCSINQVTKMLCRAKYHPKNFSVAYIQQGLGDYKVCQEVIQQLPNQAAYSTMISTDHFSRNTSYLIDLPGVAQSSAQGLGGKGGGGVGCFEDSCALRWQRTVSNW
jgi:hypothetical protein